MRSIIITLCTCIASNAILASDRNAKETIEQKIQAISTTTAIGSTGVKTAVSRPEPQGSGWFLSLDVLYWQTKLMGSQYAQSISSFTTQLQTSSTLREAKFDWDFGLKAGLGYNLIHDGWDVFAEYTYFRNNAHDEYSVSQPAAIFPLAPAVLNVSAPNLPGLLGFDGAEFATQSEADVKVRLDDLILELGRGFFISSNLALRPSFGLKASWLKLINNSKFTGGGPAFTINVDGDSFLMNGLGNTTVYFNQREKVFGLGPRGALDAKWYLGKFFSVEADIATALLFGYFDTLYSSTYSGFPSNYNTSNAQLHTLIPTLAFRLGLNYDKYIMYETQHIAFSLSYDTQYYWDCSYLNPPFIGGLGIYGVSLNVRWDF